MMTDTKDQDITVTVVGPVAGAFGARAAEHGIKLDVLRTNLDKCLDELTLMIGDLEARSVGDWSIDNVIVSLAVSAEGSIGIVSGGVQASIAVTFARAKKTAEAS